MNATETQGRETRSVQATARAFYKRSWDQFVDHQRAGVSRAGPALVTAARMLGVGAGDMQVGIVPRQNRPAVPLPDARRADFLVHLEQVVAASFDAGVPGPGSRRNRNAEAPEPLVTGSACVLCQGHCCILGGDSHAFQTRDTIDDFRRRHPALDAEGVVAFLRDALPARSVEHSCVYHGARGCVLERTDRANVCNTQQCNQKRQLVGRLRSAEDDRVAWIALEGGMRPVVAVVGPEIGYRLVPTETRDGAICDAKITAARRAVSAQLPEKLPEPARGGSG